MNVSKLLKVASVCAIGISIALYCSILFQSFSLLEFQYALFLLYFAEAFLILFAVFVACSALNAKTTIDTNKIKKGCIASVAIVLIGCIALCGYAYVDCYNSYTPENLFETDVENMQTFYPYNNIDDYSRKEKDPINLSVSHIPGTDYIYLYCYDTSISEPGCDYEVEYVKSISPFVIFDFMSERIIATSSNSLEIDVIAPAKTMKVDGVKFRTYIDGNNYAVLFNSLGKCVYASLLDAPEDVTVEDFAREIINQTNLLDKATDEKVFLDLPLF